MKCPNAEEYCPSEEPLEVHHTDQYSTYYCQDCGYEEKVVWDNPKDSPKKHERPKRRR